MPSVSDVHASEDARLLLKNGQGRKIARKLRLLKIKNARAEESPKVPD